MVNNFLFKKHSNRLTVLRVSDFVEHTKMSQSMNLTNSEVKITLHEVKQNNHGLFGSFMSSLSDK